MINNKITKLNLDNEPLYYIGKSISLFGSSIYAFAIGLYVLRLTGSGLCFATTLILSIIPVIIFSPVAGILVDRYDAKKLVILGDMLNGLLFLIIYLISRFIGLSLGVIYLSTFLTTVLSILSSIGIETIKPNLFQKKKLIKINANSKIVDSLANILSPILGGIVYSVVGMHLFIIINSISFIVAGLLECKFVMHSKRTQTNRDKGNVGFKEELKETLEYLTGLSFFIPLMTIFLFINLFLALCISIPLPYIINNYFGYSTKVYGIIQSGFPVGLMIGATVAKGFNEDVDYCKIIMRASYGIAIVIILIGVPLIGHIRLPYYLNISYYGFMLFMSGYIVALIDIPIFYIMQTRIADEFRGRSMSVIFSGCKIIVPIAYMVSGLGMGILVDRGALSILGVVYLIICLFIRCSNNYQILEGDI